MTWGKSGRRIETGVYRAYRIHYDEGPDFTDDFAYNYDGEATILRHPNMAWRPST